MARQQISMPSDNQIFETVLYDAEGYPAVAFNSGEYVAYEPDGSAVVRKCYQSLGLMCGCQYHPGLNTKLTTCSWCRYPKYRFPFREKPKHGIVCLQHTKKCIKCHTVLCGHHTKMVKGKPYCPKCAFKSRIILLLKIFFTYEEN